MEDLESRLTDFLSTPARQAAVVDETGHRPWPLPDRDWLQAQTWDSLLFMHWRVPAEGLRAHVPEELPLDTFDGTAWLGVTPFRLSGLRLRGLPPVPYFSSFLELNVRTYVRCEGKAGIYFFSLDAESTFAVEAARRFYRLPYFRARMAQDAGRETIFTSERTEDPPAAFHVRYSLRGPPSAPVPGSLEHFLTERYCLFALDEGRVHWAEIHHPPWPLQGVEAEVVENTMPPAGIHLSGEPVCHFSARQDVVLWGLEPFEP